MVHALRRARRIVTLDGCVVDLHPTAAPAAVRLGSLRTGAVDAGDAPLRHAAADAAVAASVEAGLFTISTTIEFEFYTYGDTIDELRHHVATTWRDARIDDETVSRTRKALRAVAGVRPQVVERVRLTVLRPIESR